MRHTRVPATKCPACGAVNDGATDFFGQSRPVPGDVCICGYCALMSVYDDNLLLCRATPADIDKLPPDAARQLAELAGAVAAAIARRKARG